MVSCAPEYPGLLWHWRHAHLATGEESLAIALLTNLPSLPVLRAVWLLVRAHLQCSRFGNFRGRVRIAVYRIAALLVLVFGPMSEMNGQFFHVTH